MGRAVRALAVRDLHNVAERSRSLGVGGGSMCLTLPCFNYFVSGTTVMTTSSQSVALMTLHQSELMRHVAQCRAGRGRWFSAASWAEQLHGLLAPRFVTTVAVAAALLWLTSIWP